MERGMSEAKRKELLQKFLTREFFKWAQERGIRRSTDTAWASYLDVPLPSLNQWINGYRLPNYENTIKLSLKLGPEVFDLMGYPRVSAIDDDMQYLVDIWGKLNGDWKSEIRKLVNQFIESEENKPNGKDASTTEEGAERQREVLSG